MSKKDELVHFDNTLTTLNTIEGMIYSLFADTDNLYESEEYTTWNSLIDKRQKLYQANNGIKKETVKSNISQGIWDSKHAEKICVLYFYQLSNKISKSKDIPELYQAHIDMLSPTEREYIDNLNRIEKLDEQMKPLQETIDIIHNKTTKNHTVLDYLFEQRKMILSAFKFTNETKEGIVESRLKRYKSDINYIKNIPSRIETFKRLKDNHGELHAYILSDMPKPPKGSKISDPTGEALINVLDKYDAMINDLSRSLQRIGENIRWVDSALTLIDPDEKRIIELYYFENRSWANITITTGWPERTCFYKRDCALKKIVKRF